MSDELPPGAVVAVGTAVNSTVPGLSETIERAMVTAIHQCNANGITDPDVVREAKLAAMNAVLATYGK